MGGLLAMLNHLAAAWTATREGSAGPLRVREIHLEDDGARVRAEVEAGGARGELVARLEVLPPQGDRHTLRLKVEQWPETLPSAMEPFRRVLESAMLILELDFDRDGN